MEKPPRGLVFFDVEGVFFPRKRFLLFEVTKNFPATVLIKLLFYVLAYWLRLIDSGKLVRIAYGNSKNIPIQSFMDAYSKLQLIKKARETISALRSLGYVTVLASSGVPQQVVDALRSEVDANLAFGVKVELDAKNKLTGRIEKGIAEKHGKTIILESLSRELKISADKIHIVADDRNNLQLLKAPHNLFVGFNPDSILKAFSDVNVTGDSLYSIFEVITNTMGKKSKKFSRQLFLRKLIHFSGFATIFLTSFFGVFAIHMVIIFVSSLYLTGEFLRLSNRKMPVVANIIQTASTSEELWGISLNPLWFALGIFVVLTVFPLYSAAVGILVLCIGDSVAGITGEILGRKHRYWFNRAKSVEGTLLGLFAALPFSVLFVNPIVSLIACIVGMVFEFLPLPINDNLSIPFFTSLTVFLLTNWAVLP